ncbi:unnamed protein product [Adineta steineri]|uniref:Protein-tyrosine-phosphatase n=3 Tax=Adineta steineri TaxID=433720 RepID=A0A814L208_9BILA|nr:unnamed protein product [Adineta steineri]CAF1155845.1 unnamed protein product [Adineta steineri]CAF3662415.1 unnamed protein product [Adineta steineri]
MNKRPLVSLNSMNSAAMANLNRMTFLMSISEITPQIFISGQMAATLEQVHKLGITYILNVAVESSAIVYPKHVKLEKYEISDFPTTPISNYFHTLTDKIHAHLNANKQHKVLVHCMAGISRSTTIVIAYLMRYLNLSLRDAYLLCKRHRPICFPNLGFWNQLISYEFQLKRENSVKMVSTQFGYIPDVAYEEIKKMYDEDEQRQQNPPQPASLPFFAPSFTSNTRTPSINAPSSNNSLYLSSNHTRPIVRDPPPSNAINTIRSRSLAANAANRASVVAASTNVSNPAYQTPLFATNKQTFTSPTRYGSNPSPPPAPVNNSFPLGPTSSTVSYANSRSLPISTSPNVRVRTNYHQPQANNASNIPNPSLMIKSSDQQRSNYETTYRASFIKPLIP